MARKPNYRFERQERDRLKAAKKAKNKADRAAGIAPDPNEPEDAEGEGAETEGGDDEVAQGAPKDDAV